MSYKNKDKTTFGDAALTIGSTIFASLCIAGALLSGYSLSGDSENDENCDVDDARYAESVEGLSYSELSHLRTVKKEKADRDIAIEREKTKQKELELEMMKFNNKREDKPYEERSHRSRDYKSRDYKRKDNRKQGRNNA